MGHRCWADEHKQGQDKRLGSRTTQFWSIPIVQSLWSADIRLAMGKGSGIVKPGHQTILPMGKVRLGNNARPRGTNSVQPRGKAEWCRVGTTLILLDGHGNGNVYGLPAELGLSRLAVTGPEPERETHGMARPSHMQYTIRT